MLLLHGVCGCWTSLDEAFAWSRQRTSTGVGFRFRTSAFKAYTAYTLFFITQCFAIHLCLMSSPQVFYAARVHSTSESLLSLLNAIKLYSMDGLTAPQHSSCYRTCNDAISPSAGTRVRGVGTITRSCLHIPLSSPIIYNNLSNQSPAPDHHTIHSLRCQTVPQIDTT